MIGRLNLVGLWAAAGEAAAAAEPASTFAQRWSKIRADLELIARHPERFTIEEIEERFAEHGESTRHATQILLDLARKLSSAT